MTTGMTFAEMQALANEAAEQGPDMNEVQKGGGGARLLPVGYAYGRLVEVVELGNHPQEFGGKQKDPALEVQLGFALYNTGDRQYQNDDGTPYIIRPYSFAISRNEKARAYLLFKALNWKGTKKSFAQLLGDAFLVKIEHVPKSKTDPTLVSRVDLKGFLPPLDAASQMPYPIPAATDDLMRLFLWSHPTKAGWDALHIAGTYDDGKSKNYTQERILGALDFMGSPLQQLLFNAGVTALPTAPSAPAQPPAAPLPPGAGYAPMTPPATQPVAPEVAPAVPLAHPAVPVAPPIAAAVVPSFPQPPGIPVSPVLPSVIPAGLTTTSPSSLPAIPVPPALP